MKFRKLLKQPFFDKNKTKILDEIDCLKSDLKIVNSKFKRKFTIFILLMISCFLISLILHTLDKNFLPILLILLIFSLFYIKSALEAVEQERLIKDKIEVLENKK